MSVKRKYYLFFPILVSLAVIFFLLLSGSGIGGERQTITVTDAAAVGAAAAPPRPASSAPGLIPAAIAGHSLSGATSEHPAFTAATGDTAAASAATASPLPVPGADPPLVPDADDGYQTTDSMTISGKVTDPWGRGIAGIMVDAVPASPGASAALAVFTTDAGGNYSIPIISRGLFKIHFREAASPDPSSNSWVDEWYNNQASEDAAEAVPTGASGVDAVLTPTGVLHGHLNFPDPSQPVSLTIIAYRADQPVEAGLSEVSPMSGTPQDFYNGSLPAGRYRLLVVPDDDFASTGSFGGPTGALGPFWYGGDSWADASTVTVATGQTTNIEIDLPAPGAGAGAVFGAIYVNQEPPAAGSTLSLVTAADPDVVVASTGNLSAYSYQGSGAYFQFDNVAPGDYLIKCTLPDGHEVWYSGSAQGATTAAAAKPVSVTRSAPAAGFLYFRASTANASVSGHVGRSDGGNVTLEPISVKRITAAGETIINVNSQFRTDEHGHYSAMLTPGTYKLCAEDWDAGKEFCSAAVTVGWMDSVSGVDITMPADTVSPAIVEGDVVKPDGATVPWAEIHMVSRETGADYAGAWNPPPGDFRFDIPAGTYDIYVSNAGKVYPYDGGQPVTLKSGELLEHVDIPVPEDFDTPARISGHVYGNDVKAAAGVAVTALPVNNLSGNSPVSSVTDADGNYTVKLNPGWWRVCATGPDAIRQCTGTFSVTWNDIQAGHDIQLSGTVQTAGAPAAPATAVPGAPAPPSPSPNSGSRAAPARDEDSGTAVPGAPAPAASGISSGPEAAGSGPVAGSGSAAAGSGSGHPPGTNSSGMSKDIQGSGAGNAAGAAIASG